MNTRIVKSVIAMGLLAIPSVATLAAQTSELKVNVPFAFVVAGQKLSAGTYYVEKTDETGLVVIHARTGQSAAVLAVSSGDYSAADEQPGLSFERNGEGDAVLTRVRIGGQRTLMVNSHSSLNGGKAVASR
jgi:hypothetical protein